MLSPSVGMGGLINPLLQISYGGLLTHRFIGFRRGRWGSLPRRNHLDLFRHSSDSIQSDTLSGLVLRAGDISKLVGLQLGQHLIGLGWQHVELLRYAKLGELWLAWSFNGKTRWWWCEVERWHSTGIVGLLTMNWLNLLRRHDDDLLGWDDDKRLGFNNGELLHWNGNNGHRVVGRRKLIDVDLLGTGHWKFR